MLHIPDEVRASINQADFVVHSENQSKAFFTKEVAVSTDTTHIWKLEVIGYGGDLFGLRRVRLYGGEIRARSYTTVQAALDDLPSMPPYTKTYKEQEDEPYS